METVTFEDLIESFNHAARVILQLSEEVIKIEQKFGTASQVAKTKRHQLQVLTRLHENSRIYIDAQREANHLLSVNYKTLELILMNQADGLPWQRIGYLMKDNTDKWAKLDRIDHTIFSVSAALRIQTDITDNALRGLLS
jgi:hypothetical protein